MPDKSLYGMIFEILATLLTKITYERVEQHSSFVVCYPLVSTHRAQLRQWAQDNPFHTPIQNNL